jgi:hypothetical protein
MTHCAQKKATKGSKKARGPINSKAVAYRGAGGVGIKWQESRAPIIKNFESLVKAKSGDPKKTPPLRLSLISLRSSFLQIRSKKEKSEQTKTQLFSRRPPPVRTLEFNLAAGGCPLKK